MSYSKLMYTSSNLIEFITFWSSFYNYPLEGLYISRIEKRRLKERDLIKLFEWKNGSRLSEKKAKALRAIVGKLDIINDLKANFSLSIFLDEFKFINGAIWKIYLLHIIRPNEYPIFDQFVYKAYCFISKNQKADIPNNNKQKEAIYFSEYAPFFDKLSGSNVSRKKLDEALWAFGKFLKTPYGKEI